MAKQRREVGYESLAALRVDVERLVAAERDGRLVQHGTWPLGQALNHLGYWTEAAFTPIPLKVPWVVRGVMRLMKRRMLERPMRAGMRIPGVPEGTLEVRAVPVEEGARRLLAAMDRLERETPTQPSKALGKLTQAEWIRLTCRHAELHLGFFEVAK